MESYVQKNGNQIIEKYLSKIKYFLKNEEEWWNVASKWNDYAFGKAVETSIQIAEEVVKVTNEEGHEKDFYKFYKSVVSVYRLSVSIDKNSMMVSKIISKAGENITEITSIALETLTELKSFIQTKYPNNNEDLSLDQSAFSTLKQGSRGKRVEEIQSALYKLQFFDSVIDGIYGEKTTLSVKKFQESYNLERSGEVDEKTNDIILSQLSKINDDGLGYWLLKINPATWNIPSFSVGNEAWFHTHNLENKKRVDYELFSKVRPGDKVIGYAFEDYNSIVCLFEVEKAVHSDTNLEERIDLKITQVLQKYKPASFFLDRISFGNELNVSSPRRLFQITREIYMSLIESTGKSSDVFQMLPYFNSEGNHIKTDDKLEFLNDIESIASVISLKDVKPPLAIGLFGYWGSGKSFFMEKLSQKIDEYSERKSEGYVKYVVQVKFNSWHYSDGNLWPSLITEIFDSLKKYSVKKGEESELKKLTESLQLTSIQKEVIEKKRKELELNINNLKEEQKNKRDRLEDLSGISLLKLILSDKKISEDFSELKNKNIENVFKDSEKINEYINEVKGWGTLLKFYYRELISLKGWRWVFVAAIALIIPAAVMLIKPTIWSNLSLWASVKISLIAAFIGNFLRPIRTVLNSYFKVLYRLESVKNTIIARKSEDQPELIENEKILKELDFSLTQINEKITETRTEICDILSGKQLLNFLEQRSKDERYANQLGLISWIRKDFCMLDELLRKQHEVSETEKKEIINPQDVQLQIDRIILYIDDLDRCKEDIVVKVLEAIHLLLAFPLFVVVVGVDPRWLNNALSEKYKNLFGSAGSNSSNGMKESELLLSGAATSYDYLEKIFQIPFSLKPINKSNRDNLISYLLRNEMELLPTAKPTNNNNISSPSPSDNSAQNKVGVINDNASFSTQSVSPKPVTPEVVVKMVKLTFLHQELEFMQKVSALFGQTPRMINRYVNIYRIIKSHKSLKISDNYSEDEFIPIMTVLGVIVGYPLLAQKFIKELSKAYDSQLFFDFVENSGIPVELKTALTDIPDEEIKSMSVEPFRRNLELISRFSFRTIVSQ